MYNGAVGMTLEQGGIRAGREITMENGVNLTIKDRLTHHKTAVLAVVETSASQVDPLLKGFKNFISNPGEYHCCYSTNDSSIYKY